MKRASVRQKLTKTSAVLALLAVFVLIVTIIGFYNKLNRLTDYRQIYYDKAFIGIAKEISNTVPQGETLVVSSFSPEFKYFTEHPVVTPWLAKPDSLYDYMRKARYHYLVVVENTSSVSALKPLFRTDKLPALDADFKKLSSYHSDNFEIDLYKSRSPT